MRSLRVSMSRSLAHRRAGLEFSAAILKVRNSLKNTALTFCNNRSFRKGLTHELTREPPFLDLQLFLPECFATKVLRSDCGGGVASSHDPHSIHSEPSQSVIQV